MSEPSIGMRSFMLESVPIKRWKKYASLLSFASIAWVALYGGIVLDAKRLSEACAFALILTAIEIWSDRRRTNEQRRMTND